LMKYKPLDEKQKIKTLTKLGQNQIYNKKYLSGLKLIEEKGNIIFIKDEQTKMKINLNRYKAEDIILSYPVWLHSKSKVYYPFIIESLNKIIKSYSSCTGDSHSSMSEKIFTTFYLIGVVTEDSDHEFFNSRIALIPEEENLKIYEKINFVEDKNNKFINLPFNLVLNDFMSYCDKLISEDYISSSYFLILNKTANFFVPDNEGGSGYIFYDENFKNLIEIKILEFFAFIIQYNKTRTREIEEQEEKRLEMVKEKENKFQEENIQLYLENNLNNISYTSTSSFKKTLLKPFNKEEILLQEECDVDYGQKKFTKKDLKIREEYIKKLITNANKELIQKVEEEIIQGKFEEKQKKVVFCIPNDKSAFLSKLN
jgi:hypothetical protein